VPLVAAVVLNPCEPFHFARVAISRHAEAIRLSSTIKAHPFAHFCAFGASARVPPGYCSLARPRSPSSKAVCVKGFSCLVAVLIRGVLACV